MRTKGKMSEAGQKTSNKQFSEELQRKTLLQRKIAEKMDPLNKTRIKFTTWKTAIYKYTFISYF